MQRMRQKFNKGQLSIMDTASSPTWLQDVTSNFASTAVVANICPRIYPVTVIATSTNVTAPPHPLAGFQPDKSCHKQLDLARKPNCSYTVLIGMALRTSESGALPVNEIYSYIQKEFPFFKTGGPDGWKNSIRHSLSLGHYFRKMEKDSSQGKKGFHWEVIPKKRAALDREIERFMEEEGKAKTDITAASTVQTPLTQQKSTLPLTIMSQRKPLQSGLLAALMQTSSQSVNVAGTTGSSASSSIAQVAQSVSLDQLLSALASLDTASLQNVHPSDDLNVITNLVAAATTPNRPILGSVAASSSIPQPTPVFEKMMATSPSSVWPEKAPTLTAVPSRSRELLPHSPFTTEEALAISTVPSEPLVSLSSTEAVEKAHTITSVPSQIQLTTSIIPNSPLSAENQLPTQTALTATIQQSSTQQVQLKSDIPQAMTPEVMASSKFPIFQPDVELLKEIGMELNTDIVSFANSLLTPTNPCDNVYYQSPAQAGSKVSSPYEDDNVPLCNALSDDTAEVVSPRSEDDNVPLCNASSNDRADKLEAVSPRSEDDNVLLCNASSDGTDNRLETASLSENNDRVPPSNTSMNDTDNEELHRQRLDYLKHEIDRTTELYHSIHTTPQHATMDNGYGLSTSADSFCCTAMGSTVRQLVDIGTLVEIGGIWKSTNIRDHGSQNFSIDPTYPGANITLTELNQKPLDFYPSATGHYCTPPLNSTKGLLHSNSSVRTIAPVSSGWNYPEHVAWQLQQDLDDFNEVLRQITLAHERKECLKKKRDEKKCVKEVHCMPDIDGMCYSHIGGKWSSSNCDLKSAVEVFESEEEEERGYSDQEEERGYSDQEEGEGLTISIPLTKLYPVLTSYYNKRNVSCRKRKSEKWVSET